MTASSVGRTVVLTDLQGDPYRHRRENAVRLILKSAGVTTVVITVLIVASLVGRAFEFLSVIDLGRLSSDGWFPRAGVYDLKTIIAGTLLVTGVAMVVATPLGLGAAIYLSEYARPRMRRVLKPVIEVLAGIPSVVLGFFALTWISPQVVGRLCPDPAIFNLAAAGIGVGILVTPLIASVAEDAMRSVPMAFREASYGLGAGRRDNTLRVVLPAAVSGVVASLILGASRAIGETMVVAIAAGATGGSLFVLNVCGPGQTMTAAMTALAIGSDQVGQAGAFESLFFVGLVLFVMTFALNLVSERFVQRVRTRY